MSDIAETIARVPSLRRAGSLVTARLKRWSVDVAISGFPKCGNTWYGALLRQLLVERFALGQVPLNRLFVSDLGPLPLSFLHLPPAIPRIYYSHFMPFPDRSDVAGIAESLAPFAQKPMIVLIRDCKDVLVSYYVMEVRRFGRTHAARDVTDFVFGTQYGVKKFVGYYNAIAQSRRRGAATRITSYRALLGDPVDTLARDAEFIGAGGLGRDALARIVERYKFDNMRQMELAATEATAVLPGLHRVEGAKPDALFVRKGGTGTWREHLTPAVAAEIDDYVAAHLDPLFRAEAVSEPAVMASP